jgi:hypothetical protein
MPRHNLLIYFFYLIAGVLLLSSCKNNPSNSNPIDDLIFPTISNFETKIVDKRLIELTWSSNFSQASSDIVFKIEIQRKTNSSDFKTLDIISNSKNYLDNYEIKTDSIYTHAIRFITEDSLGVFTYSNSLLFDEINFPLIQNINAQFLNSESIKIDWNTNISDNLLLDQEIEIEISKKVNSGDYKIIESIIPSNTYSDVFAISPDSIYTYGLRYTRKDTSSPYKYSNEVQVVLVPPLNIRIKSNDPSSFLVSWDEGNEFKTDYKIYFKRDFESEFRSTDIISGNSHQFDNLNSYSELKFKVTSIMNNGESKDNYLATVSNNKSIHKISEIHTPNYNFSRLTYSQDGSKIYAGAKGSILIFEDEIHKGFTEKKISDSFIYCFSTLGTNQLFMVDENNFYILNENGEIEKKYNTSSNYNFLGTLVEEDDKSILVYSSNNSNYLRQFDINNGVFLDSVLISTEEDFNVKSTDEKNRILIQVGKTLQYRSYPNLEIIYTYDLPENRGIYGFEKIKGSNEFIVGGGGHSSPHFFRRLYVSDNSLISDLFIEPNFALRYNIFSFKEPGLVFMGSNSRNPVINIYDNNNSNFLYSVSGETFNSTYQVEESPIESKTFTVIGNSDRLAEYTFDFRWVQLFDY